VYYTVHIPREACWVYYIRVYIPREACWVYYTSVFGRKRHNEARSIPPSLGERGTMMRVLSVRLWENVGITRPVLSPFFGDLCPD